MSGEAFAQDIDAMVACVWTPGLFWVWLYLWLVLTAAVAAMIVYRRWG